MRQQRNSKAVTVCYHGQYSNELLCLILKSWAFVGPGTVVKCRRDKLNISMYWISRSMKWSVLRGKQGRAHCSSTACPTALPAVMDDSQPPLPPPPQYNPISWGHTTGGHVSLEATSTLSSRNKNSDLIHPRHS